MPHNAIVVVGSGPGIGRNTAALFAERGFSHVILLSRNASRLEEDAEFVRKAVGSQSQSQEVGGPVLVDTVPVDVADLAGVGWALECVTSLLEESKVPLEVVLYNAARVHESKFADFPVEELATDMSVAVTSLYAVAAWALPRLEQARVSAPTLKPAFLVTSGLIWKEPYAHVFSLSACKAAQHSIVESMHQRYRSRGVHCGLVVVGGVVSVDAKLTTPRKVAESFWTLYSQSDADAWELDLTMLDPDYYTLMKARADEALKET